MVPPSGGGGVQNSPGQMQPSRPLGGQAARASGGPPTEQPPDAGEEPDLEPEPLSAQGRKEAINNGLFEVRGRACRIYIPRL